MYVTLCDLLMNFYEFYFVHMYIGPVINCSFYFQTTQGNKVCDNSVFVFTFLSSIGFRSAARLKPLETKQNEGKLISELKHEKGGYKN